MPPRGSGAGKEARTPDLNLGKVALYQLSYSRVRGRHFKPRLNAVKPQVRTPVTALDSAKRRAGR
jgi:hypothetical protein